MAYPGLNRCGVHGGNAVALQAVHTAQAEQYLQAIRENRRQVVHQWADHIKAAHSQSMKSDVVQLWYEQFLFFREQYKLGQIAPDSFTSRSEAAWEEKDVVDKLNVIGPSLRKSLGAAYHIPDDGNIEREKRLLRYQQWIWRPLDGSKPERRRVRWHW
jgi:hypothetical protein